MNDPVVSVVMSVYNGERFLREAIESILEQSFREFECIFINDGSTDCTADILKEYEEKDARVRTFHQENRGLVDSLNRACDVARGKYIARMDADDICFADRLMSQVNAMENRPLLGAIGGAVEVIDWSGKMKGLLRFPLTDAQIRAKLFDGDCVLCHPTVMLRTDVYALVGGYRRVVVDAEDYDLWLRIAEHAQLANLEVPVLKYRRHLGQVSTKKFRRQALSSLAARAAAVSRRSGGVDPLYTANDINNVVLKQLGQDEFAQRAVVARSYITCIRSLIDGDQRTSAVSLMDEFLRSVEWGRAKNPIVADFYLLKAYLRWNEHRYGESLISAAYAVMRRPIIIARPIKRLLFAAGVNLHFDESVARVKMVIAMLSRNF